MWQYECLSSSGLRKSMGRNWGSQNFDMEKIGNDKPIEHFIPMRAWGVFEVYERETINRGRKNKNRERVG